LDGLQEKHKMVVLRFLGGMASSGTAWNRRTRMQRKHNEPAVHQARDIQHVHGWRKMPARFRKIIS